MSNVILEISQPQIIIENTSNDIVIENTINSIDIGIVKQDILLEVVKNGIVIEMPGTQGMQGIFAETFETISKNMKSYPYVINYIGDTISDIVYSTPGGNVIKSFSYSLGELSSITINGITKSFGYSGGNIVSVTYS